MIYISFQDKFSGQIPLNPETNEMPEGIEAQAHQALKNVKGLLESQGLDFSNVIKTTVFLDNMEDFNTVNEIYATYFVEPFPARSAVVVISIIIDADFLFKLDQLYF